MSAQDSPSKDPDLIEGDPIEYWKRMTEWLRTMPTDKPTSKQNRDWRAGCECNRAGLCFRCQAADEIERLRLQGYALTNANKSLAQPPSAALFPSDISPLRDAISWLCGIKHRGDNEINHGLTVGHLQIMLARLTATKSEQPPSPPAELMPAHCHGGEINGSSKEMYLTVGVPHDFPVVIGRDYLVSLTAVKAESDSMLGLIGETATVETEPVQTITIDEDAGLQDCEPDETNESQS